MKVGFFLCLVYKYVYQNYRWNGYIESLRHILVFVVNNTQYFTNNEHFAN